MSPENASKENSKDTSPSEKSAVPSINLPKGGGAIRGIGEKFAANPVTGTGSMSIPLATSPGRSGFSPQLSLSYDSGAGNGPFGFGWSLSLPQITRKTDKGLPQYFNYAETDVFILSGAEDLVPILSQNAQGQWVPEVLPLRTVDHNNYHIQRYRPRIEGLFARIEHWTNQSEPTDSFWRSISSDNITTWYGKNANSRIAHPDDPSRIFSWLLCESHDDKGNLIVYSYKEENSDEVDLAQANERNRTRSANRYLKRIRYGNHTTYLPQLLENEAWPSPPGAAAVNGSADWFFEVVFDYGEHDQDAPRPNDTGRWTRRNDPFSTYRASFEVRTYRLCQRILMFHHFDGEEGVGNDCLVRSTDFTYSYEEKPNDAGNPVYSLLLSVTQNGYKRDNGGYLKRSLPPVEFGYTRPVVQDAVEEVPAQCLENLPVGVDGTIYQWIDLHGEGIPGILTEQGGAWFYKRNLSPVGEQSVKFAPVELVAIKPNLALASGARFMDLAGDGQPDLVLLGGPVPGLYEHDESEGWQTFHPFSSRLNREMGDPNLKFVDLNGDGHADLLITEDDAFVWHNSLAEEGFGPARRVAKALDEEKGPRLVLADGTQSIYLADLSGDGLTDLVRIRNGEVCYWPNLGYGHFGAKVTMDNTPNFDNPDQFDQKRLRLADIDGSGTTDIIYLHRDGVRLYFNQSGNGWSTPQILSVFPRVDDLVNIVPTDLLGNGTACLVWSSSLPGDALRPMRYVNLMGGQKPNLLVTTSNNLGAETRVRYAPSTKFYLQDKQDGKSWITRLPFPVHVVERVETYDQISRNRFVTRYSYHHGYFDGEEREFRGFGMVEQWDTEHLAALSTSDAFPVGNNILAESHVPPVHTKTWFHTGVYLGREHVSDFFAGLLNERDVGEYYPGFRSGDVSADVAAKAMLLDDTVLPTGLSLDEAREACRSLKGAMLRQEVYALDGTDKQQHPYTVTEQNFTIERLQARGSNHPAVFFTHPREAIYYHYERNPADPRVQHALTLEVDTFGNVLKSAAIGYGRRQPDAALSPIDQEKQTRIQITLTENRVTNSVEATDDYRNPLPCESRTCELTGLALSDGTRRFTFDKILAAATTAIFLDYENPPTLGWLQKRLIEHVRTYYRPDDLGVVQNDPLALLPLGTMETRALSGENYKLAFTSGLIAEVYGGRASDAMIGNEGRYVHSEGDANWWIPAGRIFSSPIPNDTPSQELAYARQHFFMPQRYRDQFHTDAVSTESFVTYDIYDLLVQETCDALGNRVTVGERNLNPLQPLVHRAQNYRVLQPAMVMDPNRNRTAVAYDALGMVVGTAVMGKPEEVPVPGDRLTPTFRTDLTQAEIDQFLANPKGPIAALLLDEATSRIIYDHTTYWREPDPAKKAPTVAATLARETHASEPVAAGGLRIQAGFSYSDGFGREIQRKIQAEPGPVPMRDANGTIIVGADGQPVPTPDDVAPRWVGNGWTVFNNKGKPVRQYEPFFTDTHRFEFDVRIGVSPVFFYDPVERVVATLHPNHTWEKVVIEPWRQETWDVNDTILVADPRIDGHVGGFFSRLAQADYLPTWYGLRTDPANLSAATQRWPDPKTRDAEKRAAEKTSVHAATPAAAHADSLGRTFLTVAHNTFTYSDTPPTAPPVEEFHHTRINLDIEGNQRDVIDAKDRIVMHYDYDMLGNRVHQASMEAGERWMLNDTVGKPLYAWDSRNHRSRIAYDPLRRPTDSFLREGAAAEVVVGRSIYGESRPNPEVNNLRGKVIELRDQAGVVTSDDYDFRGNLKRSSRRLAQSYKTTLDWSAPVPLQAETYTSRTLYDALNRQIQVIAPHSDQPGTKVNVIQPSYNEANLLEQVNAWLNQNAEPAGALDPATADLRAVTNVNYNAKSQRTRIDHGTQNGKVIRTTYTYDRETFRLTSLYTRRGVDPLTAHGVSFSDDCDNPLPPPLTIAAPENPPQDESCGLQNLHYTYDPAGNITHIRDDAQQTVYFRNKRVEPSAEYTYDAVYRLIEATGREHLGQVGGPPVPHSSNDAPRVGLLHPGDGNSMGRYLERYLYDAVGNFLLMQHRGTDPASSGWNRAYDYSEPSILELGVHNNRLTGTMIGGTSETYSTLGNGYDAHGNMLRMPHLQVIQWDFKDQMQMTRRQAINAADADGVQHHGERTWYVYDSAGQRVRKVTESGTGQIKDERIYLGGFEIYRRGGANPLERDTLHIMDGKQRIALIETRSHGNQPGLPAQLIRYQFDNHLGSASLELDDQAQIISYEEYTPYGSTSYQAVRNQTETSKRYRYTGKERDEESGLCYYGARYYVPWSGRWLNADPIGIGDAVNTYSFTRSNPVSLVDDVGYDTKPVSRTNNYRELLRESVEHETKQSVTEAKLDTIASQVEKSKTTFGRFFSPYAAIKNDFDQRVSLFGRTTTKLKDFKPPGWEESGGDPAACFSLACKGAEMTLSAGDTPTGGGGVILYEKVAQRIKTDSTASELALSQIKVHVDSGRSVVAGVNEPASADVVDANKQPVTDHFVAIYGYEVDERGTVTALLAKDNAISGTGEVRFNVHPDGSITKPAEKRPTGEEYMEQEYQLSEVRFHTSLPYTGKLEPKNDAKQIMYWPH